MKAQTWIRIAISLVFLALALFKAASAEAAAHYKAYVLGGVFYEDENKRGQIKVTRDSAQPFTNYYWEMRVGATVVRSGTLAIDTNITEGYIGPFTAASSLNPSAGGAGQRTADVWITVGGVMSKYGEFSETYEIIAANSGWGADTVDTQTMSISALPTKEVRVKIAVISTCPDPAPWLVTVTAANGSQTGSMTAPTGTEETPSEVETLSVTINVEEAYLGGATWTIKAPNGVILDSGGTSGGDTNSAGVTVGNRRNELNPVRITCPRAMEPPETTTGTDGNTGTTTTTTTGGTPPEQFGPPAPGGTTTTTTTTTQPGTTTPGGTPPAPTTYTDRNTKFEGAGNPETAEMTKQDFYEGTKAALKDAGNSSGVAPPGAKEVTDYVQDDKGKSEDVEGAMQAAFDGIEDTKSGFMDKLAGLDLDALPTSIGTVSSINFGTLNFGSSSGSLNVNLNSGAMGTALSLIRTVFLFGMTIGWIVLCVSTVREYL